MTEVYDCKFGESLSQSMERPEIEHSRAESLRSKGLRVDRPSDVRRGFCLNFFGSEKCVLKLGRGPDTGLSL